MKPYGKKRGHPAAVFAIVLAILSMAGDAGVPGKARERKDPAGPAISVVDPQGIPHALISLPEEAPSLLRLDGAVSSIRRAVADSADIIIDGRENWEGLPVVIHEGELPAGFAAATPDGVYLMDGSIHLRNFVDARTVLHEFGHHIDFPGNAKSPLAREVRGAVSARELKDVIFKGLARHAGEDVGVRAPGQATPYSAVNDREDFAEIFAMYRYGGRGLRALMGPGFTPEKIEAFPLKSSVLLESDGFKEFSDAVVARFHTGGYDAALLFAKYLFLKEHVFADRQF